MTNKTAKFRFQRSPNVTTVPVTGLWCYPSAEGRILCDFYHERARPTLTVTHKINDDHSLGQETAREIGPEVLRDIVASAEMSPQAAYFIGQYLMKMAQDCGYVEPGATVPDARAVH